MTAHVSCTTRSVFRDVMFPDLSMLANTSNGVQNYKRKTEVVILWFDYDASWCEHMHEDAVTKSVTVTAND